MILQKKLKCPKCGTQLKFTKPVQGAREWTCPKCGFILLIGTPVVQFPFNRRMYEEIDEEDVRRNR